MVESPDLEGLPELALLEPGTEFGNYVVQECVGQGAMGSVYRAVHALLAKPVALKIMDSALLGSVEARQRFLREGQAAASIKHPNVVDITDVGFMGTTPYLVMELLEGEDLSTYLERSQRVSEAEAMELFLPIIAALAVAHDSGVVHRDIKPSNIFIALDRDGEVDPKLLDFGISKLSSALASKNFGATPFNQLLGSPLYLPPEAVNGSGNMTPKSDQYSLGVVLYECLIGAPPFGGSTLLEVLNAISTGVFPSLRQQRPELSPALESAILRATDRDPGRRFEHMRDFGRALIEVATVRTQMRWGRSFGRRDLSDPPRSLPASAFSVAAPRAAASARWTARFGVWQRSRRVGLAAGAILVMLLGLISWIGSTASEHEAVHAAETDATSGDPRATPASVRAGVASPDARLGAVAVTDLQGSAAPPAESTIPRRVETAAELPGPELRSGKETGARRRREVAGVRAPPPAPAASEPRVVEVAAPPRPVEVDELNPFSIQRVASPPGRRRAVIVRGANEAPILD